MEAARKEVGSAVKRVDRIRIISGAPAQCHELTGGDLAMDMPDVYRVHDLVKTDEEKSAIGECVAAINRLRSIFGGFDPITVPEERIHIVSEEEFRTRVAANQPLAEAKTRINHVYMARGRPLVEFQATLVHELLHAISYLWLDFHEPDAITDDGIDWPPIIIRRQGMELIDPSYGTWLPHFHGLNEGVTETAAVLARKMMADESRLLGAADRELMRHLESYGPLVPFIDLLIAKAAGSDSDAIAAWSLLFRDYLTGTDAFLQKLEERLPGATNVLRCTGAMPHELLPAAERLGLAEMAQLIRLFCH